MRFSTTRRRPGGLRAPWPLPPSRRGVESANAQSFLENDTAGEETEARDNAGHRSGRRTQAGLNKGEARNALARALFFNQLGELRDRRFENQSYRASGLNLLVAAIILWNTRYLEQAWPTWARPTTWSALSRRLAGSISRSPATIAGSGTTGPGRIS